MDLFFRKVESQRKFNGYCSAFFFKRTLPQALHKVSFVPVEGSVFTLGEGWCLDLFEVFRNLFDLQTYGDLHRSQEKGVPGENKNDVLRPFHSPKLYNDLDILKNISHLLTILLDSDFEKKKSLSFERLGIRNCRNRQKIIFVNIFHITQSRSM